MASDGEACCESDPNFAVICAFLEKFGPTCGISNVDFVLLQEMLENTHEVSPELIELHIKLLRKARKSVSSERWERAIIRICHTFCSKDAWEMERFGYRKARLSAKIRILKELLEMQFDYNPKFKTEINKMTAEELRAQPIGRDKLGNAYWLQCDENCQLRVYKEDPDEETWTLVAKDRDGLVSLISQLNSGDTVKLDLEPIVNEDSNSTEVEKPIVDTGQVLLDSDSKKEETDSSNDVEVKNGEAEKSEKVDNEAKEEEEEEEEEQEEESDTKEEEKPDEVAVENKETTTTTPEENVPEDTSHIEENFEEESALNLSQKKPLLRIKSITELMSPAEEKNQTVAATPMKMQMYSAPVVHRNTSKDRGAEFKRYLAESFAKNLKRQRLNAQQDQEQLGEAIEEPVMYVYGEGNGKDCQTGNEKLNSNNSDCDNKNADSSHAGALNDNKKSDVENSISSLDVISDGEHSVPQGRFKLGTIVDVKSDGNNSFVKSPTKKTRWDVGKPEPEVAVEETSVKKPMFFFGPGCLQFKPAVQNETQETSDEIVLKETANESSTENESKEVTDETDNVATDVSNVELHDKEQEISETKLESNLTKENEKEEIVDVPAVIEKDEPVVETNVLQEIKEQVVDVAENTENVLPPCVEVSLPSEEAAKNEEVKEEPVVKKLAYECGSEATDEEVKMVEKENVDVKETVSENQIEEEPVEKENSLQCGLETTEVENEEVIAQKKNEETVLAENVEGKNSKENSRDKSEELANANVLTSRDDIEDTKLINELNHSDLKDKEVTTPVVCNATINTQEVIENVLAKTDEIVTTKTDSEKSLANIIDKMCNAKTAETESVVASIETALVQKITEPNTNESHEKTEEVAIGIKEDSNKAVEESNAGCEENVKNDDEVLTSGSLKESESSKENYVDQVEAVTKEIEESESKAAEEESVTDIKTEDQLSSVEKKENVEVKVELSVCQKKEEQTIDSFCIEESSTKNEGDLEVKEEIKSKSKSLEVASKSPPVVPEEIAVITERRVTRASKNKQAPVAVEQKKKVPKNKKTNKKADVEEVPSSDSVEASNTKTEALVEVEDETDKNVIIANDDNKPTEKATPSLTLSSFTLDYDGEATSPPPPILIPKLTRKRSRLSTESKPDEEVVAEKRQKLRGKRTMDAELRRSIESQKSSNAGVSSSEEGGVVEEDADADGEPKTVLKGGKGKRRRKKLFGKKKSRLSPVPSSDVTSETSRADSVSTPPVKKAGGPRKRKTTLLGLELPANSDTLHEPITGVRQSRRIAQLKIKEEAERRKIEESVLNDMKADHKKKKSKKSADKDYKADTRRKDNQTSDDESTVDAVVDEKKKKRKIHKDFRKLFDGTNPWLESSDSSSSNEVEEEEEEDIIDVYTEEEPKSDHEFSPESDLEDAADVQPLKRARTAKKESDVDEVDDCACEKCGKKDHPEWILLCDGCDNGWHCSCLRPALLVIPEGDWFCPPCQHIRLIQNLQARLRDYDKKLSKKNIENRRKERLAYVGISLNNVLPAKDTEPSKTKRTARKTQRSDSYEVDDEDSEESESSSTESSSDSDDEPIYRLRERRQAHSYRFNDYDELINSAIQDEMEAVKGAGNQGRGKDISTIVNAEKEEEAKAAAAVEQQPDEQEVEPLPPVVPKEVEVTAAASAEVEEEEAEEEEIAPRKRIVGRKKPRKLNSLDISSGDDHYSDEDFKGTTSTDDEDEEDLDDVVTDSSASTYGRRNGPVRRSTRARVARYDREFINDDSDDDDAPRRKKTRSIWDDESESEESDRSWGGRKGRKKTRGARTQKPSAKRKHSSKKKKKRNDDSDSDAFKRKRKPKVKYGRIGSDTEDLGIRTRGKKINYLDVLGSDSDDDVPKRSAPKIVESEEEYVVNDEDVLELENNRDTSEDEESADEEDDNKPTKQKETNLPNVANKLDITTQLEKPPLNPIEEINKNIEEMSETDMEKLMEEESYANKQLALVAQQIEKEKRRKEQEAKNLEMLLQQHSQKTTKKRGRNDPPDLGMDLLMDDYQNNAELSEPPGVTLPLFADIPPLSTSPEETPKKRKGRGKGKKTLAAEAAAKQAAEAAAVATPPPPPPPPLSSTTTVASPLHNTAKLSVAAPPQPFSQSQPAPSVITRMLQSQSPYAVSAPGGYYGGEPPPPPQQHPDIVQPGGGQYIQGGRVPVSSPYRSAPPPQQPPINVVQYQMRPGAPPPQTQQSPLRNPPPPPSHIYQHRAAMDPSPSGGGAIDRNSPALIPPPADSPLSNKSESTPPPPPYNRTAMLRYPPASSNNGQSAPPARHVQMMAGHVAATRPNNMSPYPPHPSQPPIYYGSYGPPPPLVASEEALPPPAAYQTPPYPTPPAPPDHYGASSSGSTDGPGLAAISENGGGGGSNSRGYDEEQVGGEFGGLVSYFSSQREDDLDT